MGVPRFGLTRSSQALKRAFDLAGAAVGLVLAAPFMALIALAVQLDSHGPVLFRQTRVGRDGEPFQMLKFRSMVDGADALKDSLREHNEAEGLFKIEADPRITRVGQAAAPDRPRRAAAALQRPRRRHEPGRPAPTGAR